MLSNASRGRQFSSTFIVLDLEVPLKTLEGILDHCEQASETILATKTGVLATRRPIKMSESKAQGIILLPCKTHFPTL